MNTDVETLITNIENWAVERNIIGEDGIVEGGGTYKGQLEKLKEEVQELLDAKTIEDKMDAIGDITVVLIILSAMCDTYLEDCLELAYEEIKDRKGKMIDGVFVKEADL